MFHVPDMCLCQICVTHYCLHRCIFVLLLLASNMMPYHCQPWLKVEINKQSPINFSIKPCAEWTEIIFQQLMLWMGQAIKQFTVTPRFKLMDAGGWRAKRTCYLIKEHYMHAICKLEFRRQKLSLKQDRKDSAPSMCKENLCACMHTPASKNLIIRIFFYNILYMCVCLYIYIYKKKWMYSQELKL